MWKLYPLIIVGGLAACASAPLSHPVPELSEWSAFRAHALEERDAGRSSPVETQEKIETRYRDMFGIDPAMEGAFAYGLKLYEAADAGDFGLDEADRLAQTHIDEALAHRESLLPLYVFPPEASD